MYKETYTIFSNIIRNYQKQNPLEYKELFLKCPNLKINLNDANKRFSIYYINESCYFMNDIVLGTILILCGVEYECTNWRNDPSILYYRCRSDLCRKRHLAEFNISNYNYSDCTNNRYFIDSVLTKLFQMSYTHDYSCLAFPNPYTS